jgi:TolB-like protein
MPNKLSQFWQELKRRKVVRVITVYAAAAFVILELIDIVSPSLRLPEWTMNFIIVLLCVGFIITVIFSWVYDIHPEGRIVKTEPVDKIKTEEKPASSKSWRITSYVSFVVIVVLIVLNIIPRSSRSEEIAILDKSIAVLPFRNDSPDQENEYFINGTMESILNNLCKIEDLRVVSRSTVEQYRDTVVYIPDVAKKMMVSYVLEGSMQKYGNRIRLNIQLIDHNDTHLWSEQYDREIDQVEDQLDLQSEIAQLVAREINVTITPEEKQLIEKIPTSNLTAYDLYQRGQEELRKYFSGDRDQGTLEKVEELYKKALSYDSSFAEAYAGLARVYIVKRRWSDYFAESYLDSAMKLADIALSHDKTLSEAYRVKGLYYFHRGDFESAKREFDTGITYNPNDWKLYYENASRFGRDEAVKILENAYKAASLHRGPELVDILGQIAFAYYASGFYDLAKETVEKVAELGDSVAYYNILGDIERDKHNYLKAIEFFLNLHRNDTTYFIALASTYMRAGQKEESLKIYKKYLVWCETTGAIPIWNSHRIGYAYWINGYKEEGDYYLNKLIEYSTREIQLERGRAEELFVYYDLAGVYAFYGETEKALEYLRIFNRKKIIQSWFVDLIKSDPLLDNIRDEPEFQQIVHDVEAK